MICEIRNKALQCNLNIPDGRYFIDIRRVDEEKPANVYRRQYFSIIDEVAQHVGESRGTMHNRLKDAAKVNSTTSFTVEQWVEYLEQVKKYLYLKLDLIY